MKTLHDRTNTKGIYGDREGEGAPLRRVCLHVLRDARDDVRIQRTAMALVAEGHAVTIIDIISGETAAVGAYAGIQMWHVRVPDSFRSTRFQQWTFIVAALLLIRSCWQLLRTPADIYHACEVTALPACFLVAGLRRKPLIFEAYELPLGDYPPAAMNRRRRFAHLLLTLVLAYIVPRCAGVITVSPLIVNELRKRYSKISIQLIRNVPPLRQVERGTYFHQELGLSPHIKIALYQGYLQPDRSLDILIRAAAYLEPGIVIVLMGKSIGRTQQELEALIERENVAQQVKIIPAVPYATMLDCTACAHLGLIICNPDYTPNIRMLLPNKLFEYLMAGLPVLASQLDVVAEVINRHDVGQMVSSLKPEAVGAAISALISDRDALTRLSEHALRAAAQEFCWEKENPHLVHFYQEVTSPHG